MIKINLLTKAGTTQSAGAGAEAFEAIDDTSASKMGLVKFLLVILGPLGLFYHETQIVIPELEANLKKVKTSLSKIKQKNAENAQVVQDIKKFKDDQAKLEQQIKVIESLKKDRLKEIKILDTVQREMPEKLWFTKIELKDKKLRLSGMSESQLEYRNLMELLSRSAYLKEVRLEESSDRALPQATVKEFTIFSEIMEGEQ